MYRTSPRVPAKRAPRSPLARVIRAWLLKGTFKKLARRKLGQCSACRKRNRKIWWLDPPKYSPLPPIPDDCRCLAVCVARGIIDPPPPCNVCGAVFGEPCDAGLHG